MSNLTIHLFLMRDFDTVQEFLGRHIASSDSWNAPSEMIRRKAAKMDGLFWVAKQHGEIIGTVMAGEDGVRGWIYSLVVASDIRRQGVGGALLRTAEAQLKKLGCVKINLQVRNHDATANAFYNACGYQQEERASYGKPLKPPTNTEPSSQAKPTSFSGHQAEHEPIRTDAETDTAHPIQSQITPSIPLQNGMHLTPLQWSDFDDLHALLNESDIYYRSMGLIPFPCPEMVIDRWLYQSLEQSLEQRRRITWAIRNPETRLVGEVSLVEVAVQQQAELGYWLGQSVWGRGIATEAGRQACQFGFEILKLKRITGRVFATNTSSQNVLKRLGFTHEGTMRNGFFFDDGPVDDHCYGLLSSEWNAG